MLNSAEKTPPQPDTSAHQPVMVDHVLDLLLRSSPDGHSLHNTLIDGTIGGGGHAHAILQHLAPDGLLMGFDRDPDAIQRARQYLGNDPRVTLLQASYADIADYTPPESVSAVLLDLGLSSDQLNSSRGFAFSADSPLDMRFDPAAKLTASNVVNQYSAARLRDLFFRFGEEPLAPRIARNIITARKSGGIHTTGHLAQVIGEVVPSRFRTKITARIFQAIRIEVNREIEQLETGLEELWKVIKVGGVLVVIAYHSIEDRRVKRFIAEKVKGCICPPRLPVCVCGRKPSAASLTHTVIRPSPKEIRLNHRSRSARLRAAVKISPLAGS